MLRRRYSTTIFLSLACSAMFATFCVAQAPNSAYSGRNSSFGQSGFGQGGQSTFSGSAFGGAQGGRGQSRGAGMGMGQSAFGGSGMGQQALGNNQLGVAGQGGFLGGDAAQTQNFFRNMNGGQRRTAMLEFMIENLNDMRDRGNRGNGRENTPPVRVKLRPAFETPLGTMQQLNTDVQSRLTTSVSELGVIDTRITMDGRTLTLEGTVGSEHQRELAAKIASLEPGVSSVDNQLIVDPSVVEEE